MGRLIDADPVLGNLSGRLESMKDYDAVKDVINNMPTAYDVDKVVDQLEKRIQTHERCIEYEKKNGTITEEFQQRKAVEVLKEAIEIVKGGGVNGKEQSQ